MHSTVRPKVLVCRAVFDQVIERLALHFDLQHNQADEVWDRAGLIARLQDCDGAFTTGSERIDAQVLATCPKLKICANMAVGYNNFDLQAMSAAGVLATNTPGVLTETTADMGFALLMATARRLSEAHAYVLSGQWKKFSYDLFLGGDIHGATLGILGMGRIGQAIARRGAHGFGMRVIYHNRSKLDAQTESACRATYVSKHDLYTQADHLILVLPYSKEAHHIVGAAEIALMKPSATLVNIGRGGLVDENALADALEAGRLAGAGLDVFEGEPQVNPRLLTLGNVTLSPHMASASRPTRLAMADLAADNLIAFFGGKGALTPLNAQALQRAP